MLSITMGVSGYLYKSTFYTTIRRHGEVQNGRPSRVSNLGANLDNRRSIFRDAFSNLVVRGFGKKDAMEVNVVNVIVL